MKYLSVLVIFFNIAVHTSTAAPIKEPIRINIVTLDGNYEINKYEYDNGDKYIVRKYEVDNPDIINAPNLNKYVPEFTEFYFDKPRYDVNTNSNVTGIIGHFTVITSSRGSISFGLQSGDRYINTVFRVGPASGFLYADTPVNVGTYVFDVTADVIDERLHAVAKVVVNVRPHQQEAKSKLLLNFYNVKFELAGRRTNSLIDRQLDDRSLGQDVNLEKNLLTEDDASDKNTHTESKETTFDFLRLKQITNALDDTLKKFNSLWYNSGNEKNTDDILKENIYSFRRKRAVPPKLTSIRPSQPLDSKLNSAGPSKRIYQESLFADVFMSGFVIFVISFGTLFFFGSITYFAYKRLKKCGDYEMEEDKISTSKQSDEDTVYSTVQSEMKHPNIDLGDLQGSSVVDSIEIRKQKLKSHPVTIFTIQKSYEERSSKIHKSEDHEDIFVLELDEVQPIDCCNEGETILYRSNSLSRPTITATFVNSSQEQFPQSILSSSRRNSVSSMKSDASFGSGVNESTGRRKSVTFSETLEHYHG